MRHGKYSKRKVRCPNASRLGYGKWEASPGDIVTYTYANSASFSGRVLGCVSAPADGPNVPAVKGWLVVLELRATFDHAFVRWIDPELVTEVRSAPKAFPAWFFGELPPIDKVLAADSYGSLDEHYIERAKSEGRL